MAEQITGSAEDKESQAEVDPWAVAFAALEQQGSEAPEDAAGGADGDDAGSVQAGGEQTLPDIPEAGDAVADAQDLGGLGDAPGVDGAQVGGAFAGVLGITQEQIEQFRADNGKQVRDRAIREIAQEFVKRGARNRNGKLGATLDDPDICKRDEDGVPRFYNPETGHEFTGDNPRRQAQEWVDDYNRELARVFDDTCAAYEQTLLKDSAPKLAVMEFAPKYEKLDDIRRGMLDNVLEDYEIKDGDGDVIGYSCDLDKALALVDRQIAMIQNYAKSRQKAQQEQPTGPAVDMKTSSGAVQGSVAEQPKSLAEALEIVQNRQLEKLRSKR